MIDPPSDNPARAPLPRDPTKGLEADLAKLAGRPKVDPRRRAMQATILFGSIAIYSALRAASRADEAIAARAEADELRDRVAELEGAEQRLLGQREAVAAAAGKGSSEFAAVVRAAFAGATAAATGADAGKSAAKPAAPPATPGKPTVW